MFEMINCMWIIINEFCFLGDTIIIEINVVKYIKNTTMQKKKI